MNETLSATPTRSVPVSIPPRRHRRSVDAGILDPEHERGQQLDEGLVCGLQLGVIQVVSDDRRLRTVARGLGAQATGTIGVIVRAVEEGFSEEKSNTLVRRVDEHGLHMTGELRERSAELTEETTA